MAKRSTIGDISEFGIEPKKVIEATPQGNTHYVMIRSKFPATIKYQGSVSGETYQWNDAGEEIPVREEDVEGLLQKRLGERPCCGGDVNTSNYLLERVY